MWGWMPEDASARPGTVAEFVATDTDARWRVDVGEWTAPTEGSGARATRGGATEPSVVVAAPVEDLALWAWTRGGSVSITGEPQPVAALEALLTQGMQ
jgi:hypothetical protein